ncbi:hypothetical protein RRG08_004130 [Elysia crispata]|uniref:Uncharacterized protein n=1 Tax=Elysia crispata TaxID=231223 RepID=A0AAE1D5P2_9GAST|nr:hypothetical protein RRG08_004130 [Elysia crispata]
MSYPCHIALIGTLSQNETKTTTVMTYPERNTASRPAPPDRLLQIQQQVEPAGEAVLPGHCTAPHSVRVKTRVD